jgi:hypothetical protein
MDNSHGQLDWHCIMYLPLSCLVCLVQGFSTSVPIHTETSVTSGFTQCVTALAQHLSTGVRYGVWTDVVQGASKDERIAGPAGQLHGQRIMRHSSVELARRRAPARTGSLQRPTNGQLHWRRIMLLTSVVGPLF